MFPLELGFWIMYVWRRTRGASVNRHKMYTALAKHGGMSLTMKCKGDLWIDDHHTADKLSVHPDIPPRPTSSMHVHRIARLLLVQLSRKPWVKSGGYAAMAPVLLLWMRLYFSTTSSASI
jgi:hypothetical protein